MTHRGVSNINLFHYIRRLIRMDNEGPARNDGAMAKSSAHPEDQDVSRLYVEVDISKLEGALTRVD
jgi:hypothetical protein